MNKKVLVAIMLAVLVAGCTGYKTTSETGEQPLGDQQQQSATGPTIPLDIKDFRFSPTEITIKKDTTVTWTQKDSVPHTVTTTSGPESFDSGTLSQGEEFSYTFQKTGTYEYYCSIHPNMKGKVTVTE